MRTLSHSTRQRRVPVVPVSRALSKLGLASRSETLELIANRRLKIDGRVVTNPELRVVPERIRVEIDNRPAKAETERRLIAFHKPRGVVTTRRDPQGRKTVFDVLGDAGRGLIAVGRLDLASTGLLLFTNDTQLANQLTDPASGVRRRYVVTVRGRVTPAIAEGLEAGIDVNSARGKRERLAADRVEIRKASARESHLIVDLTEGKNREIRRLFEASGHEVTRLHRIAYGDIELGDLAPGEWRREELGN